MDAELMPFRTVLETIAGKSPAAWIYLPRDRNWNLSSRCAVLESDEVPPELEDEPDAGVPEFAIRNELIQVLPVTVLQEIVANVSAQRESPPLSLLFRAFEHYYKHDAFIELSDDE